MERSISCVIDRELATLSTYKDTEKKLTLTGWNRYTPKLDIRTWKRENGELKPLKGITLNIEEAKNLSKALTEYLIEWDNGWAEMMASLE